MTATTMEKSKLFIHFVLVSRDFEKQDIQIEGEEE